MKRYRQVPQNYLCCSPRLTRLRVKTKTGYDIPDDLPTSAVAAREQRAQAEKMLAVIGGGAGAAGGTEMTTIVKSLKIGTGPPK